MSFLIPLRQNLETPSDERPRPPSSSKRPGDPLEQASKKKLKGDRHREQFVTPLLPHLCYNLDFRVLFIGDSYLRRVKIGETAEHRMVTRGLFPGARTVQLPKHWKVWQLALSGWEVLNNPMTKIPEEVSRCLYPRPSSLGALFRKWGDMKGDPFQPFHLIVVLAGLNDLSNKHPPGSALPTTEEKAAFYDSAIGALTALRDDVSPQASVLYVGFGRKLDRIKALTKYEDFVKLKVGATETCAEGRAAGSAVWPRWLDYTNLVGRHMRDEVNFDQGEVIRYKQVRYPRPPVPLHWSNVTAQIATDGIVNYIKDLKRFC